MRVAQNLRMMGAAVLFNSSLYVPKDERLAASARQFRATLMALAPITSDAGTAILSATIEAVREEKDQETCAASARRAFVWPLCDPGRPAGGQVDGL